jgi:short-subunit dehydrogenase
MTHDYLPNVAKFNCTTASTLGKLFSLSFLTYIASKGHAVAHLVEALHYKPEGRGFDSRLCHWSFSLT